MEYTEYIEKCKRIFNLIFNDEKNIQVEENYVFYYKLLGNISFDNEPQGVMCIITDENIIVQSIADYSHIGYEKIKITLPLDCKDAPLYAAIKYCLNETEYFINNIRLYGVGFTYYDFNQFEAKEFRGDIFQ